MKCGQQQSSPPVMELPSFGLFHKAVPRDGSGKTSFQRVQQERDNFENPIESPDSTYFETIFTFFFKYIEPIHNRYFYYFPMQKVNNQSNSWTK